VNFFRQVFRQLLYYSLRTRVHFRSHDKDGGHIIRSATVDNPMLHADLMAVSFIKPELWAIELWQEFSTFFVSVTLTLTWWPLYTNLTSIPQLEIHCRCKYELSTSRLSKVIVWQTDRQTDTTEIIYTLLREWSIKIINENRILLLLGIGTRSYNSSSINQSINQYRKCLHRDVASTVQIITVFAILARFPSCPKCRIKEWTG